MPTPRRDWDDPPAPDGLSKRLAGLERLLGVTRELAADVELNDVLTTITTQACAALDCERASLYQYDPAAKELYTRVVTELEISEIRHAIDTGITGDVATHRRLANVPVPADDPRWNSTIDQRTGFVTRSILAAPLSSPSDGRLLGVLEVINKHGPRFDEFDEELIEGFSQHASVALDRARFVGELRRRQEIETSLNVARDIQRGFMPSELPQIDGYELAAWWAPNQAVGADYCDVVQLDHSKVGLVVADVSGHGIGPSLIMASVRSGLRALALQHSAPDDLLQLLGRSLAPDLQDGRFVTMVLVQLDPVDHTFRFANAGHAPAFHYVARQQRCVTVSATGLPLGVLDEPELTMPPVAPLAPGDMLVLCTDGIVEAMNHDDECFGLARLETLVRETSAQPVEQIVETVGSSVEAHYAGSTPPDDLTILVARRRV